MYLSDFPCETRSVIVLFHMGFQFFTQSEILFIIYYLLLMKQNEIYYYYSIISHMRFL